MKKIIKVLSIALLVLLLFKAVFPTYHFKYYYSNNKSKVFTRVTFPNTWIFTNQTYFTPGYYNKYNTPDKFIKPIYSSDGDWAEYITFHSKGIFITGSSAEIKNLNDSFYYFNGSYNNEFRHLDSIENSLINKQKIALYSFDK